MNLTWIAMLLTIALFVGMLITFEVGRRIGVARLKRDPEGLTKGAGAAEGAVFALLGLLLAFTFSGAASRFEARRFYIDSEANAIGTAYLRLDLLPEESQAPLRELFRRYTDNRVTVYQGSDLDAVKAKLAEGAAMQSEIWKRAVAASQLPGAASQAAMLLLPALNQMIEITTARTMARRMHPPIAVYIILVLVALVASLFACYAMSGRRVVNWIHRFGFAVVMTIAFYLIVDFEFPRLGLIRVDSHDQLLIDLRRSMN